jgi:cytochrome c553
MCKSKFILSSWLIVAAVLTSGMVSAEAGGITASAANGKIIFTEGKGEAAACTTCHGEQALGNDSMGAPRLANIGYGYVVKQLTNFAQDKRTPEGLGAVMNGFAKALSEQDRRDVAAYVNTLNVAPELSDLSSLKAEGQQIGQTHFGKIMVQSGLKDKVSACASCHGFNGVGVDPIYPKIGQQKYVYLVNQLKNWRDGSRANDPLGQMRAIAKNLTDDDIYNVAAFLSQAPPTKLAGDRVPDNNMLLHKVAH